jgi:AraC-like DNA-binding protein
MAKTSRSNTAREVLVSLPAVHALHLAELLERWGVTHDELFAELDSSEEALADPELRLPIATIEALIERAHRLSGEPGLGVYLGMQMRISAHGLLGFAAMTSATVRDAIEIAARFAPLRTTAIGIRLEVDGDTASVVLDEHAPLGAARETIIVALLVGIWQIGRAVTGRELSGSAELAFPEPSYFARFSRVTPGTIRFSQPTNRLVFDASMLDLPLTMADPAALRLAKEQCEEELDALGYAGRVTARVRSLIPKREGGVRTLDEVVSEMHMSSRTLKRRLAEEGSTFSELLEGYRRDRAMLLLRSRERSVEDVADELGYADPANFTRAFRRWTGLTPRAFRNR